MHIFFENPFLTTWQIAKKLFSHPYTLFVFFKIPKKHYKIGEKQAKKNLGPSFDATLDQVLTQKTQILDQVLTLQHIYICIYFFLRERERESEYPLFSRHDYHASRSRLKIHKARAWAWEAWHPLMTHNRFSQVTVLIFWSRMLLVPGSQLHLGASDLGICLPLTGVKIPKIGKRGFRSQKTPISQHPRKGHSESKNPHFPCSALYRNGDFLTQSALFWGAGKWGFFDSETLFSRFWGFWPL